MNTGGIDDVDGSWLGSSWIETNMLVFGEGHILKIAHKLAEKRFIMILEGIGASWLEDIDGS